MGDSQSVYDTAIQYLQSWQSQQIKRGLQLKLKSGHWPFRAPVGYLNERNRGHSQIVVDAETAPMIREIFALAAHDFTSKQISDILAEHGFVSRSGKSIKPLAVQTIRKNPFYSGMISTEDGLIQGNHEALVSPQEFKAAQ